MTALLLPHVKTFIKNTARTEGIQITLYLIVSSISLARHCCLY